MPLKVLYLPGLLGSLIGYGTAGGRGALPLWLDLPAILQGGLALLQLGPDGMSPGPLARGVIPVIGGVLPWVYGPLLLYMRSLGWDVYAPGYDWRTSIVAAAQQLYPGMMAWADGQPIYMVAHSQGGLVARALWAEMAGAGHDAQLARIVTLCTPHYGSLEPVRLWWRMPAIYQALVSALGWRAWLAGQAGPAYLDDVIAGWPCWYELTAFAGSGPLWAVAPDQAAAIYAAGYYGGANPYWSQRWATAAAAVQAGLATAVPAGRLVSICGVGQRTAYQLDPRSTPDRDAGYLYSYDGDGLVTRAQTVLPGASSVGVEGGHATVLLEPGVWAALASIVPHGVV